MAREVRKANTRIVAAVTAGLLLLCAGAGLTLSLLLRDDAPSPTSRVQRYFDSTEKNVASVTACRHATDIERSIPDLYVCDVRTHDPRVFSTQPRPPITGGQASLCFYVASRTGFFGVPRNGVCTTAASTSPFYRVHEGS